MGQGYRAGVGMMKRTVRGLRSSFAGSLLEGEGGGLGRRGGEGGCRTWRGKVGEGGGLLRGRVLVSLQKAYQC